MLVFFFGAIIFGEEISIFGGMILGKRFCSKKPMQQILMKLRDPKCLTFTISERHELFRVLLQGAHAEVIIAWLVGWLVFCVGGDGCVACALIVFVRWRFQRLSSQSDRRQNEELIPFTT